MGTSISTSTAVESSSIPAKTSGTFSEAESVARVQGGDGAEVYRTVSRAAVLACVFSLLGLVAFTTPWLLPLPLVAIAAAVASLSNFRRYPEELVGKPAAIAGLALGVFTLFASPAWHAYVYATEVPEGYVRVNFDSLMTKPGLPELPTDEAIELDGKDVFIKGYIHPNSMDSMMSKRFVIVPDLGTCCFGGQPPLTHMIEVTLTGEQYAKKSFRKQRLAGTLHVNRNLKPIDGLTGVFYSLKADILK